MKGINVLSAFYYTQKDEKTNPLRLPVAIETIKKITVLSDLKTKKIKRTSAVFKNELMRQMITQSITNSLLFKYILGGS